MAGSGGNDDAPAQRRQQDWGGLRGRGEEVSGGHSPGCGEPGCKGAGWIDLAALHLLYLLPVPGHTQLYHPGFEINLSLPIFLPQRFAAALIYTHTHTHLASHLRGQC